MDALHVTLAAAAVLLVPSGLTKLRQPLTAHRALRAVGLPSHPAVVRLLGWVEVVVAVSTLAIGNRAAPAALATLYAGFALFVLGALWTRAPIASCGCFGATDTPPTPAHVAVDAGIAAVAIIAAVGHRGAPVDFGRDSAGTAIGVLVAGIAVAVLLSAVITRASGTRAAHSPLHPR